MTGLTYMALGTLAPTGGNFEKLWEQKIESKSEENDKKHKYYTEMH